MGMSLKRLFAVLLCMAMLVTVCACGKTGRAVSHVSADPQPLDFDAHAAYDPLLTAPAVCLCGRGKRPAVR